KYLISYNIFFRNRKKLNRYYPLAIGQVFSLRAKAKQTSPANHHAVASLAIHSLSLACVTCDSK
ncbi:MAG TPA: hypothetical protein PLZ64_10085, partial [Chitinophagales bacterium]|nr:hypothetical protein [Chitinophagales bacterium]